MCRARVRQFSSVLFLGVNAAELGEYIRKRHVRNVHGSDCQEFAELASSPDQGRRSGYPLSGQRYAGSTPTLSRRFRIRVPDITRYIQGRSRR